MAQEVIDKVIDCLHSNQNFILEAGAGAGKTHTLMETIRYVQKNFLRESGLEPKILCVTFTNVAKDEIQERLIENSNIIINTLHEFFWDYINQFQPELIKCVHELIVKDLDRLNEEIDKAQRLIDKPRKNTNIQEKINVISKNQEKLNKYKNIEFEKVKYKNYRVLRKGIISHDDLINISSHFLDNSCFFNMFINSFTHIFIDEYQDTNVDIILKLLDKIKKYKDVRDRYIVLGLFGDQMQRIYSNSPINIDYSSLNIIPIPKLDNYRTCGKIVKANNKLRGDGLIQEPKNNDLHFEELLFVYNLNSDKYLLNHKEINIDGSKRLFLSHKSIAEELGFSTLSKVFSNEYNNLSNDKLLKLEDNFICHIINHVISILYSFLIADYRKVINKIKLREFNLKLLQGYYQKINELLTNSINLKYVVDEMDKLNINIEKSQLEEEIDNYLERDKENFIEELYSIDIDEYLNLYKYLEGKSSLETLHGVKGAEYTHVIINMFENQPWNKYNFEKLWMYGNDGASSTNSAHLLFYVACTRAKHSLVINYIANDDNSDKINQMFKNIKELFDNHIETKIYYANGMLTPF